MLGQACIEEGKKNKDGIAKGKAVCIKIRNLAPDIKIFSYKIFYASNGSMKIEFHPIRREKGDGDIGVTAIRRRAKNQNGCSTIRMPPSMKSIIDASIINNIYITVDDVVVIEINHAMGIPKNYMTKLMNHGQIISTEVPFPKTRTPRFKNYLLIIPRESIGFPDKETKLMGELVNTLDDNLHVKLYFISEPDKNEIRFFYSEADGCFRSLAMVRHKRFHVFKMLKTRPSQYKFQSFENNILKFKLQR